MHFLNFVPLLIGAAIHWGFRFSVKEDTDVTDIIDIMDKNGIMMLPVVQNDGRLIGVCSRSDVLKEILNERFVTIGMKRTVTRTIGEGA